MTTIREVRPHDWATFRAVRLAALADSPSAFRSTLADAEQRTDSEWENMVRARCTSDASAIWLAESDDGRTVGVVGGDHDVQTSRTELVSMWVAPDARGAGIARRLIDSVIEWARGTGADTVALWVMRSNDAAVGLYETAGFEVTIQHDAPPDDPCRDEIRMIRPI